MEIDYFILILIYKFYVSKSYHTVNRNLASVLFTRKASVYYRQHTGLTAYNACYKWHCNAYLLVLTLIHYAQGVGAE